MTSDEDTNLTRAIKAGDGEAIVKILEPRVFDNTTTDSEVLLCGVHLLMPPLVDEEAASRVFSSMYKRPRAFEAAVWDAYRYSVLYPDGDQSFEEVLKLYPNSAIATHLLSMVASMRNDHLAALALNRRSRSLRQFPFNLTVALRTDPDLTSKCRAVMWQMVCDLVVDRSAEGNNSICTAEGALQLHWDNLIVGTRLTKELWDIFQNTFGKPLSTLE